MTPHAHPVQRAEGPRVQVAQGALGGAALLLQAPRGEPSNGASGRSCAKAHADRDGGTVRALPPTPSGAGGGGGGSNGDNMEGATQGSGAALAPIGRSQSPRRHHGSAVGADTTPRVPSPSVAPRHQGGGGAGGGGA